MKKSCYFRGFVTAVLAACLLAVSGLGIVPRALAHLAPARPALPDFDRRLQAGPAAPLLSPEGQAALARLKARVPALRVAQDPLLGSPRFIYSREGFLTGPGGQGLATSVGAAQAVPATDPHHAIKAFLNEHAALFGHGAEVLTGARINRDFVSSHNGLRTVVWQQQVDGIAVFEQVLIGHITQKGELVNISSHFLPNLEQAADAGAPNRAALQATPPISAQQAIVNAAPFVDEQLTVEQVAAIGGPAPGPEKFQRFTAPSLSGDTYARLRWLGMSRDALRLCWEVILNSRNRGEMFQVLVDAQTGDVLLRRCLTSYISDATYNVYTSDSPSPFSPGHPTPSPIQPALIPRVLVTTNAVSVLASPNGWINDGDNETRGNNVDAHLDRDDNNQPDLPRPQGNPTRVFNFALDLTQGPGTYGDAAVVQLFYWNNWMHDKLYELGFTEAAGNFQIDNFGRGGLGNDAVQADAQDGLDLDDLFHQNNANMGTPPDGFSPRMQMYKFPGPDPDRDGDLDAEVILHEYTHGLSNRRVGGGVLITALQTRGMGEGWSDFYGVCLLSEPNDDINGNYAVGGYLTSQFFGLNENYYYGIRRYPYTTDLTKHPLTFKDIDPTQASPHTGVPRSPIDGPFNPNGANEVHNQGEVWCVALWDARANLITKHGFAVGNQLILQLVTDGMNLSPANPNFLEARDAIILADRINNGAANFLDLWRAFAKRGMGASATSPGSGTTVGVVEAFDLPGLSLESTGVSGGNGNGVIDFNECNDLHFVLANNGAAFATGVSGRLSTATPGVIIVQSFSAYPNIPVGSIASNLVPFKISTSPAFVCGTAIDFVLLVKSDQETRTNRFRLNSGVPGPAVRFNNNTPLNIPDDNSIGVSSPMLVSGLPSAVSKVTVSLHLTHTFDGDLVIQLLSPDGTTVTLSANNGGAGANFGTSCAPDVNRTTFDDAATNSITSANAPFVGTFRPEQPLSAFTGKFGTNVNGTWQLHIVDNFAIDIGTLQCWSLFLSPASCTDGGGECPGVDLALGMIDSPDPVIIGSNLTYTITVTNNGPNQAKGVVLNQSLPASVVFVSASTSQGSCLQSGGSVSCSLGNMDVGTTATVTVLVTPTTPGLISSTASVTSNQPDFEPSNNSITVSTRVNSPSSELSIGLADAPDPVELGGALTYTVSVTNNGPSTATGVFVTNTLPANIIFGSAESTQGSCVNNSGTVVCSLGSLTAGTRATITILVSPTALGTITATALVRANQVDPFSANNTASASTSVSPSSDLTVSLVDAPDPVVVGSNLVYVITVTNLGPSPATSVILNQTLPPNVGLLSALSSQGACTNSGNIVTCNLGTLPLGASASATIVVTTTNVGTLSSTASATSSQTDPNSGNNSATVMTTVAAPFVSIVAGGSTLTAESLAPANGAIDLGETVTLELRLRNAGNVNNTNLVATLQPTGGVTSPSGSQTYGILPPGGLPVSRAFTFTASGTNGGTITATLQLQDGPNNIGNITFNFSLPSIATFSNSTAITIPDSGAATPYPSTIAVAGVTGLVGRVTVTLVNMSHTFARDVDVLLEGAAGQKLLLMSNAGEGGSLSGVTLTLDSSAPLPLPGSGQIASGTYQPTDYDPGEPVPDPGDVFPAPAPAAPYGTTLSIFNGNNPNGTWSLYVVDDTGGDQGSIASGWSLAITTITPVNQVADLSVTATASPNPVLVAGNLTYTLNITNHGPNTATSVALTNILPASVNLVSTISSQGGCQTNGSGVITCNLGNLSAGSRATVTISVNPTAAGVITNTATLAGSEIDFALANNSASVVSTVNLPLVDLLVTQLEAPDPVVVGSNLTYTITVTNQGPDTALDVVLTDPLPASVSFLSADSSQGSCSNVSGSIVCSLSTLPAGAGASLVIIVNPMVVGVITNTINAGTSSSDTNSTNNSAQVITTVVNPAPLISAVGSALVSESLSPANGTIDSGETVTLNLTLTNIGTASTTNLTAKLEATGGVTSPSSDQLYGILAPGGPAVTRPFMFVANGTNGGAITATLTLFNNDSFLGTVAFNYTLPATTTFANTTPITIPESGPATAYPSTIAVAGLEGLIGKVTVTLNNLSHAFPDDVDILLVGPEGQKLILMSDTGGGRSLSNVTLTFDDPAANSLPNAAQVVAGIFKPTDFETGDAFSAPAPAGPYEGLLSVFNSTDPNGTWSLYVLDDTVGDGGSIAGGWSLTITVLKPINPVANLAVSMTDEPDPVFVGNDFTYTINVTNLGPADATGVTLTDMLPASLNVVSAASSQGSCDTNLAGTVTCNLGSLSAGAGASATIVVRPTGAGTVTNTISVLANEADLSPVNNTAHAATTVLNMLVASFGSTSITTNGQFQLTLTGQPGQTYIIEASLNLQTWTPVSTNAAAANGVLKFTDPDTANFTQRFYRSRIP